MISAVYWAGCRWRWRAGAGHFALWWLSGIVLAAAFVPLALFGPRHILAQCGAIFLTLFVVGSLCIEWEAAIFLSVPKEVVRRDLAAGFALYLIASLVLALLAKGLKLTKVSPSTPEFRSPAIAAIMIGLSGFAYVVYYLVFGGITYQFFTKQYYPEAQAVAMSLGFRFWLIELARGVPMTLAVLPVSTLCGCRVGRLRSPSASCYGSRVVALSCSSRTC